MAKANLYINNSAVHYKFKVFVRGYGYNTKKAQTFFFNILLNNKK